MSIAVIKLNKIGQHVVAGHICSVTIREVVLHVLQLIAVADQHVFGWRNVGIPVIERGYGYICVLTGVDTFRCFAINSPVRTYSKSQMDLALISGRGIGIQNNCIVRAIRLIMWRAAGNIAIRKRTALRHVRHVLESNVPAFHFNNIRIQLAQVYDIADPCTVFFEKRTTGRTITFKLLIRKPSRGKVQAAHVHPGRRAKQYPVGVDQVNVAPAF